MLKRKGSSSSMLRKVIDRSSSRPGKIKPAWNSSTSMQEDSTTARDQYMDRKVPRDGLSRIRRKMLKKQLENFENRPFV